MTRRRVSDQSLSRGRDAYHVVPVVVGEEREKIELAAAKRAYAAGLGASEWPAFLTTEENARLNPRPNGKPYSDPELALIAAQSHLEHKMSPATTLEVVRVSLFGPAKTLYRVWREDPDAVCTMAVNRED